MKRIPGFIPILSLTIAFLLVFSCKKDPNEDIKDVQLSVSFVRTDSMLLEAAKALHADTTRDPFEVYATYLSSERDFLFYWTAYDPFRMRPESIQGTSRDTAVVINLIPLLRDSAFFVLLDTIRQVIPYDFPIRERITPPLKRLKKNFPDVEIPEFRTHADGYLPGSDMRSVDQLISLPGYMSFGLHYFLGPNLKYYPPTLPQFVRDRFDTDYFEVIMVKEITDEFVPALDPKMQPTLLDRMVHAGIRQHFVQALLPQTPDSLCLYYTASQMKWADYYERKIYEELTPFLFKIESKYQQDFLSDKPFTTSLAQESAPRIAEYCGWKIVEAYLSKHPEVTLAQLVERTDYQEIFNQARYKPSGN